MEAQKIKIVTSVNKCTGRFDGTNKVCQRWWKADSTSKPEGEGERAVAKGVMLPD